jgi:phosphoribosyl-dephospho-CoA transferase
MLAMLRGKLRPHLARLKLKWENVEPLMATLQSMSDLEDALRSAGSFILKLVIKHELQKHCFASDDCEKIAGIVSKITENRDQLKAVFAVAMPLVQEKPSIRNLQKLLVEALRLDHNNANDEPQLKKNAMAMISRAAKPLVRRKLEELGVQPADLATVSTAIEGAVADEQKLRAVFGAAMPLVQGPLTVAKVEALLEAATGLERKEVLGMVSRAAKPLVRRKLEELGVQPADLSTVSTAIEGAVEDEQKLRAVFGAAMPLVQGPLTVAKVEVLLEAATGLERKEVLGMVSRLSIEARMTAAHMTMGTCLGLAPQA